MRARLCVCVCVCACLSEEQGKGSECARTCCCVCVRERSREKVSRVCVYMGKEHERQMGDQEGEPRMKRGMLHVFESESNFLERDLFRKGVRCALVRDRVMKEDEGHAACSHTSVNACLLSRIMLLHSGSLTCLTTFLL